MTAIYSPTELAGIQRGDMLLSIDQRDIDNWNSMLDTVANLPPGNTVTISVLHNGKKINSRVKVCKRPKLAVT